jgi:uncharacterized protein (DUF1330 family)|tara:strand:- start:58 stop:360 length:303 start_codon:yes stop_codon:yes gene_type:complete
MKAYMIVRAVIQDREKFVNGYGIEAGKLVEKYGGKYLVRAPGAIALEGIDAENNSVVISEWPSKEAAQSFWNSDEYQEIKKLREGIAECYVLLIESNDLS